MSNYILEIDTSINNNTTNSVTVQLVDQTTVDVINNTTVLVSDLPEGYPLDWTVGNLPISRVSGLDIIGGSGISVLDNSGIYTISLSDPTIYSTDIVDFDSAVSGLLPVKNISAGSGIGINVIDGDFNISVTGTFGLTGEQVDNRVKDLLEPGSYIDLNYNDPFNSISINVTGLQPSGNYSVVGHSHSSSDITDFTNAVSGLIPPSNFTSLTGISGVFVTNSGTNYFVGLNDPSIQLIDITDLSADARTFLLTPSSNNLQSLVSDETGSGSLVFNTSPSFSGVPTVPTAPSGTNNDQIANTAFVRSEIANLIDSSPSTLDTLNELAAALGDDPNFATTIASGLANKAPLVHTHVVNDITDFSSGVSGLLPTISNSGNNRILTSTGSSVGINAENNLTFDGSILNVSGQIIVKNITLDDTGGEADFYISSNKANLDFAGYNAISFDDGSIYLNGFVSGVNSVFNSGNFINGLTVNNVPVSVSGHIHDYTDIVNWASGIENEVSTLLVAGNYINIDYNNEADTLTISATGLQPSGNYANAVHSHGNISNSGTIGSTSGLLVITTNNGALTTTSGINSSYITNFNSSVSGLLPSVSGSGYVNSSFNNNVYTISVSGLQPSGNYSLVGHTHSASDITDFGSSVSGLLPVKDIVAGSGIGVSSASGNFTVSVTGSFGLTGEQVDDRVGNLLAEGSYIDLYYDDDNNLLTISATGLQPSGNYSVVGHSHVSTDITDFNTAVSGLLPVKDIVAGSHIEVSSVSGVYTISTDNESSTLVTTVFNKTGSPISKMNAVYIDGGQGDQPTIALAVATGDPTSAGTYGVTFEAIPNMSTGKVIVFGALTGVDTDIFNPTAPHGNVNGQVLYLSPTTPGGLTLTKPSAPNHIVAIGTIVRTHQNEGVIEVRVQNGFELEELHNVAISGVTNGQFLQYNSGNQLWVPSSSGNFNTLLVNGTGVSLVGHTHSSSDITDFNTAVSGLLPVTDLVAGSGIVITPSGSVFTINSTGGGGSGADEIEEYIAASGLPASGDLNILYRTTDDGRLYQWSGNEYAELGPDNVTTGYHAYQHASNGLDPVLNVVSRPASLSGNVNNYAHNNADILYIDSSASYNITGLVSSSDGSVKLIINKSAFTLVLTHQDTNSDPSNRFLVPFGSNYNLLSGYGITIVYDSDAARWRVLA